MEKNQQTVDAHLERRERDRSPENAHGYYPPFPLYSDEIITLSQVRAGTNPILEDLKNNIEKVRLLSGVDVVKVDRALFEEYIDFTNMVWGSSRSIDEFLDREIDGFYYPLVAGHTRHRAIVELEEEGRLTQRSINAKVHPANSIEDILDIQLGENLHSAPSMERRALVAVEHFKFGVLKGKWANEAEYFAAHPQKEHEKSLLEDGLAISQLPSVVQNFIFEKKVSLATGIELAKTGRVVRSYIEFLKGESFTEMDESTLKEAEELYLTELVILTSRIASARLNVSAAKKVLVSKRQSIKHEIAMSTGQKDDGSYKTGTNTSEFSSESTLFDVLIDEKDVFRQKLKLAKKELDDLMRRYGNNPSSFAIEMIELVLPVVSPETRETIAADFDKSVRIARHVFGGTALKGASVASPENT